jgi:hypothetical protein
VNFLGRVAEVKKFTFVMVVELYKPASKENRGYIDGSLIHEGQEL